MHKSAPIRQSSIPIIIYCDCQYNILRHHWSNSNTNFSWIPEYYQYPYPGRSASGILGIWQLCKDSSGILTLCAQSKFPISILAQNSLMKKFLAKIKRAKLDSHCYPFLICRGRTNDRPTSWIILSTYSDETCKNPKVFKTNWWPVDQYLNKQSVSRINLATVYFSRS